jgi:hypothetical protein
MFTNEYQQPELAPEATETQVTPMAAPQFQQEQPQSAQISGLEAQLVILNQKLHKKTSVKYIFYFAMVQGIGYVFGATLVTGLVLALVLQFATSIDYLPIINQFFSSAEFKELLRSFQQI